MAQNYRALKCTSVFFHVSTVKVSIEEILSGRSWANKTSILAIARSMTKFGRLCFAHISGRVHSLSFQGF